MKRLRAEFVFVKEASQLLGVCKNTIRSWGFDGKITEYRHPVNGYRMYKREDINRLLEKLRTPVQLHRTN